MAGRHDDIRYERDAAPRRLVLGVTAATVVFGVILCVIAYGVLGAREGALRPSGHFAERDLGVPRTIAGVREAIFDRTPAATNPGTAAVDRYEWVDRERGVVRIPVERAMELLLRRAALGGPGGAP